MADMPIKIDDYVDLRNPMTGSAIGRRIGMIWDAMMVFTMPVDSDVRVVGQPGMVPGQFIEVVLPIAPLRSAMLQYGLNVLTLSIIISLFTAALVYFTLNKMLVRPMMKVSQNMVRFAQRPEDASRIILPSDRADEIGTVERELAHMQGELAQVLQQKTRLASLGMAVSKINHDLRNMLSSAQLISDRLGTLPDPTVQRFAPKLIASLDRAISFCNNTLTFGRASEAKPRRDLMPLKPFVEELGDNLGLPRTEAEPVSIGWLLEIDDTLHIDADPDHLYRILSNLSRNAIQAIENDTSGADHAISIKAWRASREVHIEVADTGPGVPARAKEPPV